MSDPGLSLRATTLEQAWQLLYGRAAPSPESPEAADVVESFAVSVGMRSRRVILEAGWWQQAGGRMIARVADRRRVPRGQAPVTNPSPAMSFTRGSNGTRSIAISARRFALRHNGRRWPSRPKPVTSVIACTAGSSDSSAPGTLSFVVQATSSR